MTYTVSGGALNPTHSLTHSNCGSPLEWHAITDSNSTKHIDIVAA